MTEYNNLKGLAYPGVYPNENETIPYSPRREFDFMQNGTTNDPQGLAYPGVYPNENETIPYSPRREFDFMQSSTINSPQYPSFPEGVYPEDNKIIPYSPRGAFGFMQQDTTNGKTITLESMRDMSTDQIVELYKNGYRIETHQTSTIKNAANGISVSSDVLIIIGLGLLAYMFIKK